MELLYRTPSIVWTFIGFMKQTNKKSGGIISRNSQVVEEYKRNFIRGNVKEII